jgi:hypothetical protein
VADHALALGVGGAEVVVGDEGGRAIGPVDVVLVTVMVALMVVMPVVPAHVADRIGWHQVGSSNSR